MARPANVESATGINIRTAVLWEGSQRLSTGRVIDHLENGRRRIRTSRRAGYLLERG